MEEFEKEWERVVALEPGSALDELVAERVMGLKKGVDFGEWDHHDWKDSGSGYAWIEEHHSGPECQRCGYHYCIRCVEQGLEKVQDKCIVPPPAYSTSPAYAVQVLEKLLETHDIAIGRRQGVWIIGIGGIGAVVNARFRTWLSWRTFEEGVCKTALLILLASERVG